MDLIPKGWFELKNGYKAYITHSGYGHFPGEKGEAIIEEIEKVMPTYVLIEYHPEDDKNLNLDYNYFYSFAFKKPPEKRTDSMWAILAGYKVGAKLIAFDVPRKKFHENIYKSFLKYSKRFAIISTIATTMIYEFRNRLKTGENPINYNEAFKIREKEFLNFAPEPIKRAIKKEGVKNLFKEWMQFEGFSSLEEFISFLLQYGNNLGYFMLYPSSKAREKYIFKVVSKFAKKGKPAVVIGSRHIETWLKNNWIKLCDDK